LTSLNLHSPDLSDSRAGRQKGNKTWAVDLTVISRYFVLECVT